MANTSIVCTNKTGILTQNVMSVVAGSISAHGNFVRNLKVNKAHTSAPDQEQNVNEAANNPQGNWKHADDFSIVQESTQSFLPSS